MQTTIKISNIRDSLSIDHKVKLIQPRSTGPIYNDMMCDKDYMSALRLKNASESDPRSYEVT